MTDQLTLHNDPVIDWELGLRLAGNRQDLARDMLGWLIENLPVEIQGIKQAAQAEDYADTLKRTHKLHGALCYCGVPRLKKAIAELEKSIKNNEINLVTALITDLEFEATQVLEKAAQIGE